MKPRIRRWLRRETPLSDAELLGDRHHVNLTFEERVRLRALKKGAKGGRHPR